jgi:hypothetical protein
LLFLYNKAIPKSGLFWVRKGFKTAILDLSQFREPLKTQPGFLAASFIRFLGKGEASQVFRRARFFLAAFSLSVSFLSAGIFAQEGGADPSLTEQWYVSNAGGMALQPSSRLLALRNKYGLMVGPAAPGELPELLREYYQPPWAIEVRVLYTEGAESRRQWLFLDEERVTRLVAVFVEPSGNNDDDGEADGEGAAPSDDTADEENVVSPDNPADEPGEGGKTEPVPTGFVEFYDGDGFLTGERQFQDDGGETELRFFYARGVLIRAETTQKSPPGSVSEDSVEAPGDAAEEESEEEPAPEEAPVDSPPAERLICTDYYRYSRSGSLRAIERVYHEPPEGSMTRIRFPHRILDSVYEREFVNPALAYGSESLLDIFVDSVHRVVYNTDQRGRILSETRLDSNDQVVGELTNIWEGDRLAQVIWKAGEDERRVEYGYNADGDRIEERNYRKGNLERVVLREGDIEVEELYMDGQPVFRARWEKGRKVSEERIPSPNSGRAK